jgi:actin-like ATPase involved in cell morphogenesis
MHAAFHYTLIVDFAVYLGDEKTLIYKRGHGIVLNEPTLVASTGQGTFVAGKEAQKFALKKIPLSQVTAPVRLGRIIDTHLAGILFAELFKKVCQKNFDMKKRCLFCIPSTLSADEFDDYKTVVYSCGVSEAEFIPSVMAVAVEKGHNLYGGDIIISVFAENDWADITVIKNFEIIDGGMLKETDKLDSAKAQLSARGGVSETYIGGCISAVSGAGKLLDRADLIKKIVKQN